MIVIKSDFEASFIPFRLLNFFSKAFLVIGPMPITESNAEYLFVLRIFFLDAVISEFIEKLDVSEEKVRLKNHCAYFIETINSEDSNGKKLGFISQELGREINTMGSKANHSEIQKLVVQMKDSLEKIKEQVLNVL